MFSSSQPYSHGSDALPCTTPGPCPSEVKAQPLAHCGHATSTDCHVWIPGDRFVARTGSHLPESRAHDGSRFRNIGSEMERAMSSGWTCAKCGAQRIRTMVVESVQVKGQRPSRARDVQSKCPACGQAELVAADPGDRIISIRYGPS